MSNPEKAEPTPDFWSLPCPMEGCEANVEMPCHPDADSIHIDRAVAVARAAVAAEREILAEAWEKRTIELVAAEREKCARVADVVALELGSLAEGQNEPQFSRLVHEEYTAHKIAAAIRVEPNEEVREDGS